MRAKYYLPIVMLFMGVLLFAANGFDVEVYQPTLNPFAANNSTPIKSITIFHYRF